MRPHLLFAAELDLQDLVVDVILPLWRDPGHVAPRADGHANAVLDQGVLRDLGIDVARRHTIAHLCGHTVQGAASAFRVKRRKSQLGSTEQADGTRTGSLRMSSSASTWQRCFEEVVRHDAQDSFQGAAGHHSKWGVPTLTLVGLNSKARLWSSAFTSTPRGMNTSPASLEAAAMRVPLCASLDSAERRGRSASTVLGVATSLAHRHIIFKTFGRHDVVCARSPCSGPCASCLTAPSHREAPDRRRAPYVAASRAREWASSLGDGLQRSLDAVKDLLHKPGAQLHAERLARAVHRIADRQPGGVLVALRATVSSMATIRFARRLRGMVCSIAPVAALTLSFRQQAMLRELFATRVLCSVSTVGGFGMKC